MPMVDLEGVTSDGAPGVQKGHMRPTFSLGLHVHDTLKDTPCSCLLLRLLGLQILEDW